jgi:hypothetical protein
MAAFEREIFVRIGAAAGSIKRLIDTEYTGGGNPMSRFRRGFVKDLEEVRNLTGVAQVLSHGPLDTVLGRELQYAIDYRDHLPHGKRIKQVEVRGRPLPPTVDDTVRLSRRILALC